MKIQDLFERDIHRQINGVVKADQLDASSVWQELDEFVITRELTGYINDLVSVLLSTIESTEGAAEKNGIWISGFFGCGKSHLLKVLSYLLENDEHQHNGERRRAADFFEEKLADAMLYADLKKIVSTSTDTILFNIDSKADHRSGRDALLQVFLKVPTKDRATAGTTRISLTWSATWMRVGGWTHSTPPSSERQAPPGSRTAMRGVSTGTKSSQPSPRLWGKARPQWRSGWTMRRATSPSRWRTSPNG